MIIIFAETVTLAHAIRSVELARIISTKYKVILAIPKYYWELATFQEKIDLEVIDPKVFQLKLKTGLPIYSSKILAHHIKEDSLIFEKYKPDVVIGDFRLSLNISARKYSIPYINLTNAYWRTEKLPVPVMYWNKILSEKTLEKAIEKGSKLHLLSFEKEYNSIQELYTDGDYTWFADIPDLFPETKGTYIGPLFHKEETPDLPKYDIYLNLGSSGDKSKLDLILDKLKCYTVLHSDIWISGYAATKAADLIICNGGSLTTQQALSEGKPVIGISSNMDQLLNMQHIVENNAGTLIRSDNIDNLFLEVESLFIYNEAKRVSSLYKKYNTEELVLKNIGDVV